MTDEGKLVYLHHLLLLLIPLHAFRCQIPVALRVLTRALLSYDAGLTLKLM